MSGPPRLAGAPLRWTARYVPSLLSSQRVLGVQRQYTPGDFLLTHGTSVLDRLIQLTTRSRWNHAAALVSEAGDLIEATDTGIARSRIGLVTDEFYVVEFANLDDGHRRNGVAFLNDLIERGDLYGWWTYPTIFLKTLTRSRLVIEMDGTDICSELVARMLEHMGIILPMRPALVAPADLYNWFVTVLAAPADG